MREPETSAAFFNLSSTEEAEEFIYRGYERLRVLHEQDSELSAVVD